MPYHKHNFKYRRVTLLADDLVSEHGIVSMRVGFALRSAEIKPLFISVSQNLKKEFQRDVFSRKNDLRRLSGLRPHYPGMESVQAVVG